jgi:hypothetical protein
MITTGSLRSQHFYTTMSPNVVISLIPIIKSRINIAADLQLSIKVLGTD